MFSGQFKPSCDLLHVDKDGFIPQKEAVAEFGQLGCLPYTDDGGHETAQRMFLTFGRRQRNGQDWGS